MSSDRSSRRRFLEVVAHGGAVAGAACLGVACGPGGGLGGVIDAGNVSALSVGSLQAVSSVALAVGRDAQGVYAMSLICPHEGCESSVSGTGVYCACHGSQFDADGNVLRGPARTALDHFPLTIGATGEISVDTSKTVDTSTRVAVPG
jgi:cytochrome b6-f complex iron-sulfur subunit